jgi:alanine dehydrogenase
MNGLSLGVLAHSGMENEFRLPIHPQHVERIDEDLRERMLIEQGYGERYGVSDDHLAGLVGSLYAREEVIASSDILLLPKPTLADVASLREGQVLWGWPHVVQDQQLAQLAIDKRLTLIAWEAMNHWSSSGNFVVHVFHVNNELAGYCSVLHAMTLMGITGDYGRPLTAAVIGFGNTARGAVTALDAMGVRDVTALTMRDVAAVASPMPAAVLVNIYRDEDDLSRTLIDTEAGTVTTAEFLSGFDIVVNCVLQDTDAPLMFVNESDLGSFAPGTLLVDVSCDLGMGFEFARPTTFDEPTFAVGDGIVYYGVDHSPSYLWNSATWGISEALLPYLRPVMDGPSGWDADPTIRQAIELRDGVVQNPKVLSFQHRAPDYPHPHI